MEYAVLVDEDDRRIGRAARGDVRTRNLLHRGIGVLCRNSRGDVYVHRRTATKDVFPSLYDMFVGGMLTDGESYKESAVRELSEELGVSGVELEFRFKHLYLGPANAAWTAIFSVTWDGPIIHQAEEIEWGAFMSPDDLDDKLRMWDFAPDSLEVYQRWLRMSQSSG